MSSSSRVAALVASGLSLALALAPTEARADPDTDRAIGMGLTLGAIAPVGAGVGLAYGATQTQSERMRVRLFAAGASTFVGGMAMFGTGVAFLGRSNAARRTTPWPVGQGAGAGLLATGLVGLGLFVLGGYARVFVDDDTTRAHRLRGLGLAGMIVGGNLAIFGTFLGAYSLGQASDRGPTPMLDMSRKGAMLGWSGRF